MLSHEDALDCFGANPDGAGYAFVDGEGKLQTRKGYDTFKAFWAAYFKSFTEFGQDSPFLIHFRIATKGVVGYANCHPYDIVTGKSAVIHNGVLWSGSRSDPISDTQELVNACKEQFANEEWVEANKGKIATIIGYGNKLAFLYDTKKFVIVNELAGDWNDAGKTIWFSNMWWAHNTWHHEYRGHSGARSSNIGTYGLDNGVVYDGVMG